MKEMMHQRLFPLLLLGLLAAGCARGPKTYTVHGKVTYRGQPLPKGVISFDPDPTRQNTGPQGFATIENGVYDTSDGIGRGVVGGAYIVRIEGFDGQPADELPLGKPLFTNYQQSIDLPREGPAEQDFNVP